MKIKTFSKRIDATDIDKDLNIYLDSLKDKNILNDDKIEIQSNSVADGEDIYVITRVIVREG